MTPISVVIPCCNAGKYLAEAVESVLEQSRPAAEIIIIDNGSTEDKYEIIVINNDSPDKTAEVIRCCAGHSPVAFSSYVEKRNGISFARNLGVAKSQHEFVAFLDDDETACPDWLTTFNAVINEHHTLVVGGRVEQVYEPGFMPPAWLNDQYVKNFFGVNYRDQGRKGKVFRIRHPLYLGAGNTAYARRLFDGFGSFDTRLGRDGKSLLAGEETYFNLVLGSNNIPMYYSDEACIRHFIESYRLTKAHLRRKAYWSGITNAIITPRVFGYDATLRKTKNSWKEIWDKTALILRHRNAPENFSRVCRIIYNLAFLHKFYLLYLTHKLRRERDVATATIWSDAHWLAEVSRWPEGPDKYRELHHYYLCKDDKENARKALGDLAAYLGLDDLEQAAPLLESSTAMNQHQPYAELKQKIRHIVSTHLPRKAKVLVVSKGDEELLRFNGRAGWHFPQNGKNVYAGHYPGDSAGAILHLEQLRAHGAEFLLFPRPAFWWLEHYADFKTHLASRYDLVVQQGDACLIYDLRNRPDMKKTTQH